MTDTAIHRRRPTPPNRSAPIAAPTRRCARAVAGQWQLAWWKFRRHKLAVAGGIVVLLIYLVAVFAEFLAP